MCHILRQDKRFESSAMKIGLSTRAVPVPKKIFFFKKRRKGQQRYISPHAARRTPEGGKMKLRMHRVVEFVNVINHAEFHLMNSCELQGASKRGYFFEIHTPLSNNALRYRAG
jgi:hypothetical protein